MQADHLRLCLDSLEQARPLLKSWCLRNIEGGWENLTRLAETLGFDALCGLCQPLTRILPRCPDADMAWNNLERFLANSDGTQYLPTLLENRARTLDVLLQLLSSSQFFSDLLAAHPDYLDMLRVPLRRSPSHEELESQLQAQVDAAFEDSAILRAFRRFRQRQILRIGANDIIRDRSLEEVTRDISRVADAALSVALKTALRHISKRFGDPYTADGLPARCVILAFGKLGGEELNYSSDIDLMFVYDEEGATQGKRVTSTSNDDFFGRVVTEVVRLLSAHTDYGQAYRVDLRLRPDGRRGPLARSLAGALSYYDAMGRTWERQALIKVRSAAGDLALGAEFLHAVETFIYRKYLSFSEINDIKALKRRIEHKAGQAGVSDTEVKTGRGGIRDIEFTIQFLQLLNGGDLPEVRQRNTLLAMQALEQVGCLTAQEFQILDDAYRFLRKTEHRLQLMFDLQTHRLPAGEEEQRKLALRMGYRNDSARKLKSESERRAAADRSPPRPSEPADSTSTAPDLAAVKGKQTMMRMDEIPPAAVRPSHLRPRDPLQAFLADYAEKTSLNRKILDHLLHLTFQSADGQAEPESDLILDPNPDPDTVRSVLERYGFRDIPGAYNNLMHLAQESVRFLSTRRCRHFLASIAPRLLQTLAETPDPDRALVRFEKVTASLGAKAVLWELFSFNPPSLKLYVELCAWSELLSEILIRNPGMIDELLDSLVLNQPRTAEELGQELADLCRGASDPDPILHSFKDKELLRIGVRDILGKDAIRETTAALSDLAETILAQIAALQLPPLLQRFGQPCLAEGLRAGRPSRYVFLALGKLGGRELSYHSDLDLILVYEGDGRTTAPSTDPSESFEQTSNFHFFTEFTQRIIKATSVMGPMGRLYLIDMRLRPTGTSGSLVIPLTEFRRYYEERGAQIWERQALTRARIVGGDPEFGREVMQVVDQGAHGLRWRAEVVDEILNMRERLEASRTPRDLKRGCGGLADVEFLVQLFHLKYGRNLPALRSATNIWDALESLRAGGLLTEAEFTVFRANYDFLRLVESRLRILHNRALDELPESPEDLETLARRMGCEAGPEKSAAERLLAELEQRTKRTRYLFLNLMARERASM